MFKIYKFIGKYKFYLYFILLYYCTKFYCKKNNIIDCDGHDDIEIKKIYI